jgi:hypothetical protein
MVYWDIVQGEDVGVYIVGVFRLDRDPSLFSWWRKILSLANARKCD